MPPEDMKSGCQQGSVCVVVCTRDRPELVRSTLGALADQNDPNFEIIVVNQGGEIDIGPLGRSHDPALVRLLTDPGTGLSRARNMAWRQTRAEWVVFVDDDCILEPDWISTLKGQIAYQRTCCFIAGVVTPLDTPPEPYLATGVMAVHKERTRRGRWRPPLSIGHGVCMGIRRDTIARLGGWDERLGTGSTSFPGGEDEEFNYRMLRGGGIAYATPDLQAHHQQWRTQPELVTLFGNYMIGRAGGAAKQLRSSDVAGGAWLLTLALIDCLILIASAARFSPGFRLRVGISSLRGLLIGLRRGLSTDW